MPGGTMMSTPPMRAVAWIVTSGQGNTASRRSMIDAPQNATADTSGGTCHRPLARLALMMPTKERAGGRALRVPARDGVRRLVTGGGVATGGRAVGRRRGRRSRRRRKQPRAGPWRQVGDEHLEVVAADGRPRLARPLG